MNDTYTEITHDPDNDFVAPWDAPDTNNEDTLEELRFPDEAIRLLGMRGCETVVRSSEQLAGYTNEFTIGRIFGRVFKDEPASKEARFAVISIVNQTLEGRFRHVSGGRYVAVDSAEYQTSQAVTRTIESSERDRVYRRPDLESMIDSWKKEAHANGVPVKGGGGVPKPGNSRKWR